MRLNWANYLFLKHDGYGRYGLGFVRALLRAGHEVHPFTTRDLEQPSWFTRAQGIDFSRATIQLMPPHEMRAVPGRTIGYSMHESMHLPDGWADHVNHKCQWLLVPSPWLIELFEGAGVEVPIEVVPGGIEPDECPILSTATNTHRPFTFGALGDRAGRKGDRLVWAAFYKAFDYTNKDVRLLVKCRPSSMPDMDFSYNKDTRHVIWREDVEHMSDVFAQMDAFMFPSHCEGFGMPPRESAAMGVPTFVTRFSGTADDCDQWAVPLNDFKLVESHMEQCGGLWAQPSLDELVWRMRDIYENQDTYKANALKAAQWMRQNATYDHAVKKLMPILAKWLHGPAPEPEPEVPAWDEPIPETFRQQPAELSFGKNGHKETVTA